MYVQHAGQSPGRGEPTVLLNDGSSETPVVACPPKPGVFNEWIQRFIPIFTARYISRRFPASLGICCDGGNNDDSSRESSSSTSTSSLSSSLSSSSGSSASSPSSSATSPSSPGSSSCSSSSSSPAHGSHAKPGSCSTLTQQLGVMIPLMDVMNHRPGVTSGHMNDGGGAYNRS